MNFTFGMIAIVTIAIAAPEDSAQRQSVLESANSEPILVDPAPADWSTQETVLEKPFVQDSAPIIQNGPVYNEPIQQPFIAENRLIVNDPPIIHSNTVCTTCRCETCCCKQKIKFKKARKIRKRDTKFYLVDTKGCSREACVKVPKCCTGEAPSVNWRRRALGRQVAKLCWECCDHEAKVVVTRRGKVKVRD